MVVSTVAPAPVKPNITIELTPDEASKLRRACYYNKTVARKYAGNPKGSARKASYLDAFMGSLGNSLKDRGVERF